MILLRMIIIHKVLNDTRILVARNPKDGLITKMMKMILMPTTKIVTPKPPTLSCYSVKKIILKIKIFLCKKNYAKLLLNAHMRKSCKFSKQKLPYAMNALHRNIKKRPHLRSLSKLVNLVPPRPKQLFPNLPLPPHQKNHPKLIQLNVKQKLQKLLLSRHRAMNPNHPISALLLIHPLLLQNIQPLHPNLPLLIHHILILLIHSLIINLSRRKTSQALLLRIIINQYRMITRINVALLKQNAVLPKRSNANIVHSLL